MKENTNQPEFSDNYRWYVLLVLTGMYAFNFIDRQILVILQEPIKAELGLTDTQLGLLTGLTFAFFYVTLALPIANLADQKNRRNIITISLSLWSLMTAVSGLAQNFVQLALARIGVGIGEAGGSPPAHSIISDYFSEEKRANAFGVYSSGLYFGYMLGFLLGGWLNESLGWRMTLILVGVPGILYAVLIQLTVKEPPRGLSEKNYTAQKSTISEVFKVLFSKKSFIFLAVGAGLHTFVGYGTGNFSPSFLARVHGMSTGEIGMWLAYAIGGGGVIGSYLGGWLAAKYGKMDKRYYIWIPIVAILISPCVFLVTLFSGDKILALVIYIIPNICFSIFSAPFLVLTHGLVKPHQRAMSSAIFFLILNCIGLGLGPLCTGMLSDALTPMYGDFAIRYALLIVAAFDIIAVVFLYQASRFINADLKTATDE